ncbi:MAG: hypothetical protein J7M38_10490, partial [Armatimonadetes bacterium]|nr:hypothetical protein [Armatimonadota bacterium]
MSVRVPENTALVPARVIAVVMMVSLPLFAGRFFEWEVPLTGLLVALCALATCIGLLMSGRTSGLRPGAAGWLLLGFLVWLIVATVRGVYL